MTQQTDAAQSAKQDAERLVAAIQEVSATIEDFADRVVQALSNPPAPASSD